MWPTQAGTPSRAWNRKRRLDERLLANLLGDLVDSLPAGVLGRLDLLSALAAQDADKAPDCMCLPFGDGHDLGQRRTFGPLHHRDYFSLLVGVVRFGFAGWLPCAPRFLRGLGFLGGCGLRLRLRNLRRRCILFGFSRAVHFVSPDRAAVVTIHHSGWEKLQVKS